MEYLSAVELFVRRLTSRSKLERPSISALLDLDGRLVPVQRGEDLILPGHPVSYSTLVVRGVLGRFDQMLDGKRQITALHIPGDMADLHSLPIPTPSWGIQSLVPSTTLQIPHERLRRVLDSHPDVAIAFWRDTVVDASILAKWTAYIGRADATTRIAHLFCELGVRMAFQGMAAKDDFPLAFTQAQIADAVGLTTVHVNRTMAVLRAACGLSIEKGRVMVRDWNVMASYANFDDSYLLMSR
ncbi:CRP-like cAMP-binding protein [Novosphingobium sp. PhB57]|nr:CRP-like cAMP-binding protein [Novosphingobium sp. PhB57]